MTSGKFIKTNYKIIKKFLKINHSNILTLDDAVSAICCCDVVDTSADNSIGHIRIRSKQK